jgi:hypothetical protein
MFSELMTQDTSLFDAELARPRKSAMLKGTKCRNERKTTAARGLP